MLKRRHKIYWEKLFTSYTPKKGLIISYIKSSWMLLGKTKNKSKQEKKPKYLNVKLIKEGRVMAK